MAPCIDDEVEDDDEVFPSKFRRGMVPVKDRDDDVDDDNPLLCFFLGIVVVDEFILPFPDVDDDDDPAGGGGCLIID